MVLLPFYLQKLNDGCKHETPYHTELLGLVLKLKCSKKYEVCAKCIGFKFLKFSEDLEISIVFFNLFILMSFYCISIISVFDAVRI